MPATRVRLLLRAPRVAGDADAGPAAAAPARASRCRSAPRGWRTSACPTPSCTSASTSTTIRRSAPLAGDGRGATSRRVPAVPGPARDRPGGGESGRARSRWWSSTEPGGRRASCSSATPSLAALPQLRFTPAGAQPLPDKARARRRLRRDRRGARPRAGRARGRAGAVRGAAAPVRRHDRHAAALRDARARRAPAPRRSTARAGRPGARPPRRCCAARAATSSACTAKPTPGRRAAPAAIRRRSSTGSRAGRASGETFEAIIAPRRPLAPAIPRPHPHPARAAGRRRELGVLPRALVGVRPRATTSICAWGRYPLDLLEAEGVALPAARLDIRPAAGDLPRHARRARRGVHGPLGRRTRPHPFAIGRGGVRLAALSAIVDKLKSD